MTYILLTVLCCVVLYYAVFYIALHSNVLYCIATPPWPVTSPDEKEGGLCTGPATKSRQNKMATETNTRDINNIDTRMDSHHPSAIMKDTTQKSNREEGSNRNENIFGPKTQEEWAARMLEHSSRLDG